MKTTKKYVNLWKNTLPAILEALENVIESHEFRQIKMKEDSFIEIGNRISSGYTFRLDIVDGNVPIKKGTAVARDLKTVLDDSPKFNKLSAGRYLLIRMGKDFILHIEEL